MKKIVVVGAGRMGGAFATAFAKRASHTVAIRGSHAGSATAAALGRQLGVRVAGDKELLAADVVLIATPPAAQPGRFRLAAGQEKPGRRSTDGEAPFWPPRGSERCSFRRSRHHKQFPPDLREQCQQDNVARHVDVIKGGFLNRMRPTSELSFPRVYSRKTVARQQPVNDEDEISIEERNVLERWEMASEDHATVLRLQDRMLKNPGSEISY